MPCHAMPRHATPRHVRSTGRLDARDVESTYGVSGSADRDLGQAKRGDRRRDGAGGWGQAERLPWMGTECTNLYALRLAGPCAWPLS